MRTDDHNRRRIVNGGYSLVELMIVIAIMTVMVGVISVGVSVMFSKDAEAAAKIIDDELSEVRMLSMSKNGKFEMVLSFDYDDPSKNGIVIERDDSGIKTVDLGKKARISVEYGGTTLTSGDVVIEFDKGNGSVRKINGATVSGVCTFTATGARVASRVSNVDLVITTGRHYVRK